jgi:uncharacterized protein involved in exopolysaccharide biosynthesis
MLQPLSYQDQAPFEQQTDQLLTPQFFYDVLKRRWLYFVIPFAIIFAIGAAVTFMLPATYVSEGKMLIESQEIPTNLVQPTVSTVADERVALLQQRIMVRDKLLAIADKYKLAQLARTDRFLGRLWPQMSATDIVDMMRDRTQIQPIKSELAGRQPNQRQFIAFTVGFENERPEIARQVANELVTVILNEDVRARTSSALETTRFLEREQKRLETELDSVEVKVADAKNREAKAPIVAPNSIENQLTMLKADYAMKSASYSESHPDMKALKEKIAALEKLIGKKPPEATITQEVGVDALERQRTSIKSDLEGISKKLATARLGENLERGQHSERLSVIEQPTLPQKPVRPNRPKILALVFAVAIAIPGGLIAALEMFSGTIRGKADLAKLIDSQLIVSIPYITTKAEILRQKSRFKLVLLCSVVFVLAGLGAAIYLLQQYYLLF